LDPTGGEDDICQDHPLSDASDERWGHDPGQKLPNDEVKGRIGYLPESHRYPGYFTGEQILRLFGQLSGVDGSTLDARIPVLLDLVGMASGGRRR